MYAFEFVKPASVADAVAATGADASFIAVPPKFAPGDGRPSH